MLLQLHLGTLALDVVVVVVVADFSVVKESCKGRDEQGRGDAAGGWDSHEFA